MASCAAPTTPGCRSTVAACRACALFLLLLGAVGGCLTAPEADPRVRPELPPLDAAVSDREETLPALPRPAAKGEADAGILVLAAEAPTIRRLFASDNVRLMRLAQADAYAQRLPFLSKLVLQQGVVDFARNAVLKATHDILLARVERARFFALSVHGRWDESVREHQDILAALKAGDADRAGRLLGHHVRRTGEIMAATLDSDADDASPAKARPNMRGITRKAGS